MQDKIENLLQRADNAATGTSAPPGLAATIRRRAHRRHIVRRTAAVAAATCIVCGMALWGLADIYEIRHERQMASLKAEIERLKSEAESTLRLVRQVTASDRRQRELKDIEAKLARVSNPMRELQRQADAAAFILLEQAERMVKRPAARIEALKVYMQIIELFPDSPSATFAREKLAETGHENVKGDII